MTLSHVIKIITTPSCWFRNYPTSKLLSNKINYLLDNNTKMRIDYGVIHLGDLRLWGNNFPYAFGRTKITLDVAVMPDRMTVFRLYDAVCEAVLSGDTTNNSLSIDN